MRGFNDSINLANVIMKGWEIYYNFITKHQDIIILLQLGGYSLSGILR